MDMEILEILAKFLLDERLNDIMIQDQGFWELQKRIDEQAEKFEGMTMEAEQRTIVENLISLHIASIDFYAKDTYKQGFKDCLSLLREVGVVKIGDTVLIQNQVIKEFGIKE